MRGIEGQTRRPHVRPTPPASLPVYGSFPLLLLYRIRRGLIFLSVLFVVGVVGHKWLAGCDWLDSVYFFVITVSTVGYGEQSEASPADQIFTIALIVVGVGAVGYLASLIVQAIIEGQFNEALGVQRMQRDIEQLSDHSLICGFGRIGRTIAKELSRRNRPYVVIDRDEEIVAAAQEDNDLVIVGDATAEEVLLEAGIERASTVVIALKSDADNVFLTLTARNLNPDLRIIARGEHAATEKKLIQAGANQVVLPAVIGGRRMAAMVTRPNAAEMLEHFTNHERIDVELEELRIPLGNPLVNQTVRETAARQRHNLLIVGIRRSGGQMVFNPNPDDRFEIDDTLVVMGRRDDVERFQQSQSLACDSHGRD